MRKTGNGKAAVYLRVSDDEQTVENQREPLLQLARARGYEPVVYEEEGSAWATNRPRPEFDRLMRDARQRKFRLVIVWDLRRLTRQGIAAAFHIFGELDRLGVGVLSYSESFMDPAVPSPMRDLLVAFFAWAAKYESDSKSAATRAGMKRAKEGGTRSGRPIGRARVEDVSPEMAERLRRAAARAGTVGKRAAARDEGLPASTLRDYMSRQGAAAPERKGGSENRASAQRGRVTTSTRAATVPFPPTGDGRWVHLSPEVTECARAKMAGALTTGDPAEVTCPRCRKDVARLPAGGDGAAAAARGDGKGPLVRSGLDGEKGGGRRGNAVHFVPAEGSLVKLACGKVPYKRRWSSDPSSVTCDDCRLIALTGQAAAAGPFPRSAPAEAAGEAPAVAACPRCGHQVHGTGQCLHVGWGRRAGGRSGRVRCDCRLTVDQQLAFEMGRTGPLVRAAPRGGSAVDHQVLDVLSANGGEAPVHVIESQVGPKVWKRAQRAITNLAIGGFIMGTREAGQAYHWSLTAKGRARVDAAQQAAAGQGPFPGTDEGKRKLEEGVRLVGEGMPVEEAAERLALDRDQLRRRVAQSRRTRGAEAAAQSGAGPSPRTDAVGTCPAIHAATGARCTHEPGHATGWHNGPPGPDGQRGPRWRNEGYVYKAGGKGALVKRARDADAEAVRRALLEFRGSSRSLEAVALTWRVPVDVLSRALAARLAHENKKVGDLPPVEEAARLHGCPGCPHGDHGGVRCKHLVDSGRRAEECGCRLPRDYAGEVWRLRGELRREAVRAATHERLAREFPSGPGVELAPAATK